MHKLLEQTRAADAVRIFAQRAHPHGHDASIGFYDRRAGHVHVQPQSSFLQRAFRFGRELQQHVRLGDPVIVACPTPETALTAFIGALAIGALPVMHATRPAFEDAERQRAGIANLKASLGGDVVVVTPPSRGPVNNRVPAGVRLVEIDLDLLVADDCFAPVAPDDLDQPLYLQSTSGTTGTGKLAIVSHGNLIANIDSLLDRMEFEQSDRIVSWLPLYHDMGLVSNALMGLVIGVDVHLLSPFDFLADPAAWLRTLHDVQGTFTCTPNFGLDHAVRRIDHTAIDGIDLSKWTRCAVGAEPVDANTLRRFIEAFEPYGLHRRTIKPCYGLAEATLMVTFPAQSATPRVLVVESHGLTRLASVELRRELDIESYDPSDLADDETAVIALGKPGSGTTVELRDANDHVINDELVCGEVVVRGASISPGYRRSDGTVDDSGTTTDGWLRTGDVGFFNDGELFVVERIKNIIIRSGENHSATVLEIELARVLGRSLDEVMVIDSDVRSGKGRVTAIVGVDRDEAAAPLITALRAGADQFEPAIEQLLLVPRGAIAKTSSGKKQHAKMRNALSDGTLTVLATHDLLPPHEHETPVVLDLDRIDERHRVRAVIERHAVRRGVTDPFDDDARLAHDLGFDSLALYELVVDIESTTGLDIPEELLASMKRVHDVLEVVQIVRSEPATGGLLRSIRDLRDSIPQRLCVVSAQRERQVEIDGRWVTDFASCNYLGLDVHPAVIASVQPAIEAWGVHPSWTRAVASPAPYRELEAALAELVGAPEVVVFPTVTLAHIGVLPPLAGPRGTILIDRAAHNSIQEAAQLASARGTAVVSFAHNDVHALEAALARASRVGRRVIVVDGIYSISGRAVDLPAMLALAERYDAVIYVDDAHGFGIIGEHPGPADPWGHRGNGVVRYFGLDYERIVYVGGLSKAYSSMAAFVTANDPAQRELLQMASTAVFSGPIPVASLATSLAAIEVNDREGDELRRHVRALTTRLVTGARDLGFEVDNPLAFPIVTIVLGGLAAVERSCRILWEQGILLTPAVFPAAPLDRGGVRFTITAANTISEVEGLLNGLAAVREAYVEDAAAHALELAPTV